MAGMPLARLPVGRPAAGGRHRARCPAPWRCSTTGWRRCVAQPLLPLLAVERARRVRESAAVAVSGVVAALSLAVALTVMVASFRDSVARLARRGAAGRPVPAHRASTHGRGDTAFLTPDVRAGGRRSCPACARGGRSACAPLLLDPARPAVTLLARADRRSGAQPAAGGRARCRCRPGSIAVYVSEAMVDLYGARPGHGLRAAAHACAPRAPAPASSWPASGATTCGRPAPSRWTRATTERLTGDARVNDLQLWLAPGARRRRRCSRRCARWPQREAGAAELVEIASAAGTARHLAAHLRPQLRRHLLAAGGRDRHRPVRRGGQLQRAGAGAAQGVRAARAPGAHAPPDAGRGGRRRRGLDG